MPKFVYVPEQSLDRVAWREPGGREIHNLTSFRTTISWSQSEEMCAYVLFLSEAEWFDGELP